MNDLNKYNNKYFSILGDSISTLEGDSIPSEACFYSLINRCQTQINEVHDTWWGIVINKLGGIVLVNNSYSGSTVSKTPIHLFPSFGCSMERTSSLSTLDKKPDVIIVFMGLNDWGSGFNPNELFYYSYKSMLQRLKENYNSAEIWCVSLPYGSINDNKINKYCNENRKYNIEEYCNIINKCSKELECKFIDIYKQQYIYESIDGYHPNNEGMKMIASSILDNIKK